MRRVIYVFLLWSLAAHAQVAFKDMSSPGSPLALSGTVTESNNSSYTLSVVNNSSKEIIAFYIVLYPFDSVHKVHSSHDWYFKPHGLIPGMTEEAIAVEEPNPWRIKGGSPQASVAFVEFADGTTWGDTALGVSEITSKRPEALAFYEHLLTLSGADFTAALESEANIRTAAAPMARKLLRMQASTGTQSAVNLVRVLVDSARGRMSNGVH